MNDAAQIDSPSGDAPIQPALTGSAGAALRAAREGAGLHIAALAVSLKVPVKKLEALEADDLAQLPDAVFARALAATVCRTLKVDPEPILRLLPQLEPPPLQVGAQAGSPRIDAHRGVALAGLSRLPKPILLVTAALLIAAIVLWWVPTIDLPGPGPETVVEGVGAGFSANQAGAQSPPAVEPVAQQPVTAPAMAASAPSAVASAAIAVATPASAATDGLAAAGAVAGEGKGAVAVFSSRSSSWVQVVGADGVVHMRKTMEAGETARINGALPMAVVIGRANAIDVTVRGKPLDLTTVAKDNVARFQIK